ncbi:MAG: hypothetical protein JXR27_07300 [Paludibacteraceae bacterium]|nr:hypothetical protein [Paludibacteraceae bacterium]
MNTTFNINRLILLIKRYFVEHAHLELSFWAITVFVFALFINQPDSVRFFMYISGLIFAARQFKFFASTPSGMHYLMIPATHTEKLAASVLLSIPYFFFMILLTYIIGITLGTTVTNFFIPIELPYSYDFITQKNNFGWSELIGLDNSLLNFGESRLLSNFVTFALWQSLFVMGSLFFKRNAVVKTMLSLVLLLFVVFIVQIFIFKALYGTFSFDSSQLIIHNFEPKNSFFVNVFVTGTTILSWLAVPFFWIVSYFRLTEKQV